MDFYQAKQCLLEVGFSQQAYKPAIWLGNGYDTLSEPVRNASILMAVMNINGRAELLLTKRSERLALHPGEIAFPGGKPESDDADCLATALREAEEEIALPASAVQYLGQLNKRITRSGFLLTPCVGLIDDTVDLTPSPQEVEAIFTIPLAQLGQVKNWQFILQEDGGAERLSPQFIYQKHVLTGVTAQLTADLMAGFFNVQFPCYEERRSECRD
ncbi:MAG: 8-oxo-dGTP pyrophosphatase MutT (NUDIX family) [Pseudohongiellaceae bacterium]|jgi:8-oxo-dGTP pyrophosphatase MutT (NUDIX family)